MWSFDVDGRFRMGSRQRRPWASGGSVEGFRTPAHPSSRHRHGGRRPKTSKGGNRALEEETRAAGYGDLGRERGVKVAPMQSEVLFGRRRSGELSSLSGAARADRCKVRDDISRILENRTSCCAAARVRARRTSKVM